MDHVRLFLGIAVEPFSGKSVLMDSFLSSLYVGNQPGCLEELLVDGTRFLGRFLDQPVDLSSLKSVELNVVSLIRKLKPDFSYEAGDMRLCSLLVHTTS